MEDVKDEEMNRESRASGPPVDVGKMGVAV